MACKLLTICALVCAIQGLNAAGLDISVTAGPFQGTLNYLLVLEKEYSGVLDSLQNIIYIDTEGPAAEFAESLGNVMDVFDENAGSQFYGELQEQSTSLEVVGWCIRQQAPAIRTLREKIMTRIDEAKASFKQFINKTIGPYVNEAREAFRNLSNIITSFPKRVYECIRLGELLKIMEVIKQSTEGVRTEGSVIIENLRRARQEFPAIREQGKLMTEQIRTEARTGMEVIHENLKECVKNGGSKETPFVGGGLSLN